MKQHVAVLMGGWSVEREISLISGREVADALREKEWQVTEVDVGRDIAAVLSDLKPDNTYPCPTQHLYSFLKTARSSTDTL